QSKRKLLWNTYFDALKSQINFKTPLLPSYATNNAHMFYIIAKDINHRSQLINRLKENGFHSVFHYISLHSSDYYVSKHDKRVLGNSDKFTDCLLRLPLFYELSTQEILKLTSLINTVRQL
ncbi:MAG: DegT/DnrJ/EryC1/StrS family aminotransferase, partial [Bacteroidia bacterium]|nr:DegT/DnrJ/EryC1/StrS family aminotransferase [Bacteroidia bacterium]